MPVERGALGAACGAARRRRARRPRAGRPAARPCRRPRSGRSIPSARARSRATSMLAGTRSSPSASMPASARNSVVQPLPQPTSIALAPGSYAQTMQDLRDRGPLDEVRGVPAERLGGLGRHELRGPAGDLGLTCGPSSKMQPDVPRRRAVERRTASRAGRGPPARRPCCGARSRPSTVTARSAAAERPAAGEAPDRAVDLGVRRAGLEQRAHERRLGDVLDAVEPRLLVALR